MFSVAQQTHRSCKACNRLGTDELLARSRKPARNGHRSRHGFLCQAIPQAFPWSSRVRQLCPPTDAGRPDPRGSQAAQATRMARLKVLGRKAALRRRADTPNQAQCAALGTRHRPKSGPSRVQASRHALATPAQAPGRHQQCMYAPLAAIQWAVSRRYSVHSLTLGIAMHDRLPLPDPSQWSDA